MKKILAFAAILLVASLMSASVFAGGPDFPEKGWHKGSYFTANVGMMQVTNDEHIITARKFDSSIDPAFGLTYGFDIADWIGPMLQINYATATSQVGDPNNVNTPVTYNGITYAANTFPLEDARQHVLDFSLFVRATLPYFTRAGWQPGMVKIIPYAKLGGTGQALFVNAPTNANKVGAFGGGPAVGLGVEFFIWKGFFVALDVTEHLIFQQSYYTDITDAAGVSRSTKVTDGGFKPHFSLAGLFGWHF